MVPGVRLVVLGKQGAGKGTQCQALSHHYVVPHIATGDMLRAAVKSGSPLGLKVKDAMSRGELLGDELIMEMVEQRLQEADVRARGFILDGCPRTIAQAETLSAILDPEDIDLVVDLEVPTAEVLDRLAGRRACVDCGHSYSLLERPRVNWTCDYCAGEVVQRDDDTVDAIRLRLELYERQTRPLIDWYSSRHQLVPVNGSGPAEAVLQRVVAAIDAHRAGYGGG